MYKCIRNLVLKNNNNGSSWLLVWFACLTQKWDNLCISRCNAFAFGSVAQALSARNSGSRSTRLSNSCYTASRCERSTAGNAPTRPSDRVFGCAPVRSYSWTSLCTRDYTSLYYCTSMYNWVPCVFICATTWLSLLVTFRYISGPSAWRCHHSPR